MGISKDTLFDYILHLADNSMILGQRNSEWCGHGPVLEQDIALTNISLDLIGEARNLYQYAARIKGAGSTEDSIAFLRIENEYRNLHLTEQPNTDWAYTIVRQFFFDAFHCYLNMELLHSADEQLREIASKTVKEATYHLKWSSEWMIRLGDGTELSRSKMQKAVNDLWEYTGDMFLPSATEAEATAAGIAPDLALIRDRWTSRVNEVMHEATLSLPQNPYMQTGGKKGIHTEYMGYILTEMQYLQRAYPGAEW